MERDHERREPEKSPVADSPPRVVVVADQERASRLLPGVVRAGNVTRFVLRVCVVVNMVAIPAGIVTSVTKGEPFFEGQEAWAEWGTTIYQSSQIVLLVLFAIVLPAFLVWVFGAYRVLGPLGAVGMRFSPTSAVLCFLVPIANLLLPMLVMGELWSASGPENPVAEPKKWRALPTPQTIRWWWLACVAYVATWLVAELLRRVTAPPLMIFRVEIAANMVNWVAAVLLLPLIHEINQRLRERMTRAA
ncbi:hypothetical protein Pan216_06150 [Planctomycetes bacterium Pan216]|uniref:DUF4328 domain-containing protein n=1 Tax=Kolteria novifilia TaxID=2527975 RepID=A0A518AYH9_9BACT|nr:hypothetical protein Pan216_06150 [Planctomycetes bacterium Pan216]